tara:strand:- start:173 stop:1033 length:861 start_codon:yes stop_codon:yes gene_type:complete
MTMQMSQIGLGTLLIGVAAYFGSDKVRSKVSEVFGADSITPAELQEMHIESSGVTVDTVPVSQVEAFMGWQQLHLQHTNAVANDSPFMDGVVDAQPVYTNPFDIGYSFDQEYYGAETYEATGDYAGQGPSSYNVANPPNTIPSAGSPYRIQAHTGQVYSMDPSTGVNGQPLAYSGATPVARLPPEVTSDFPYMVSLINVPFTEVPSSEVGSNRFGSLARNSVDENINGRFGEVALSPEVDASYTAPSGETMPLSQWRTKYTVLRHSDTTVSAIPNSGGVELQLRRV